jgi:hypothetical protein
MLFDYKFRGASQVESTSNSTGMTFSPDVSRPPTFFKGLLGNQIAFREAISALHHVVVNDLRYKPRDKSAYIEWARTQEEVWLAEASAHKPEVLARIESTKQGLAQVRKEMEAITGPFYTAKRKYFDYLYQKEKDFWFVLDPVITVHPDEIFFECFSLDEATYGRLGASYEVFKHIGEFACGTTNIDYSAALYNEFQKIREYKETEFTVDPGGFQVQVTHEDTFTEKKIDLPDSWVRGFLQVSSAMTLPMRRIDFHPLDIHNICHLLKRKREKESPRSLRFILKPGEPVVLRFEPWNIELVCPRSVYHGTEPDEIRLWGRRRLLILERLIPVAKGFTAYLLGSGMPSFFIADLGDMSFTLGLSGWTSNDWSRSGNFDLMASRKTVDAATQDRIYQALRENWRESPEALAKRLRLDQKTVEGALTAYTQAGHVIYDLNKQVYRVRELSRDPLPMEKLRFNSPTEQLATALVDEGAVRVSAQQQADGTFLLEGDVKEKKHTHKPTVTLDKDDRITAATCTCYHYSQNKLHKGPCEHMLALRMAQGRKTWWSRWLMN